MLTIERADMHVITQLGDAPTREETDLY